MAEKGESRSNRALKEATGLIAVLATSKLVRVGWRRVTGTEPPAAPDDQQITTARMIAMRYATFLLPRRQREAAEQAKSPGTSANSA